MKKVLIALLCMSSTALMTSCSKSNTDMVVDGFEELVEEVEKKKGNLTVEEWNKMEEEFNNRFEELGIDKIDEKEFSTMQKLKIVALTVRWTAHLQFCFDVRTIGPVGIFRLVIHHFLHGSCQCQQFVFWIFKAELMSYFFQDIIESLFLVGNA